MFASDTYTGVYPHRVPPAANPEDVFWKLLSDSGSPTSVGLLLIQKASAWEAWLHMSSEVDTEAGTCIAVCVVNYYTGLHMSL